MFIYICNYIVLFYNFLLISFSLQKTLVCYTFFLYI